MSHVRYGIFKIIQMSPSICRLRVFISYYSNKVAVSFGKFMKRIIKQTCIDINEYIFNVSQFSYIRFVCITFILGQFFTAWKRSYS